MQVIKDNYQRKLKRAKYARDKLRLLGKMVLAVRDSKNDDSTMDDLLKPERFRDVIDASKVVGGLSVENGEEVIRHPDL